MLLLFLMLYILFHWSVGLTNPWPWPLLELPLTYICHGLLHNGLVGCARRPCYASTWFSFLGGPFNTRFVFITPLILGVHNRSQAKTSIHTLPALRCSHVLFLSLVTHAPPLQSRDSKWKLSRSWHLSLMILKEALNIYLKNMMLAGHIWEHLLGKVLQREALNNLIFGKAPHSFSKLCEEK